MIDWAELFQMQRELDERIIREHGLEDKDLMPDRIVAFLVELSEFANEARFFKFWSKDKKPRRYELVSPVRGMKETKDPLLEEFVDALHFAIGIGLALGYTTYRPDILDAELDDPYVLYMRINMSMNNIFEFWCMRALHMQIDWWEDAMKYLIQLGHYFELTDDEIVTAYKSKHAENHARQDRGY